MSDELRSKKVEEWSDRFLRFSNCRQTVAEFCHAEGVSQPSFYAWRKKLKAIGLATIADYDVSAKAVKSVSPRSFEPVSLAPHSPCSVGLKVRLPGGIELELRDAPNVIEAVVKQLVESSLRKTGSQTC